MVIAKHVNICSDNLELQGENYRKRLIFSLEETQKYYAVSEGYNKFGMCFEAKMTFCLFVCLFVCFLSTPTPLNNILLKCFSISTVFLLTFQN